MCASQKYNHHKSRRDRDRLIKVITMYQLEFVCGVESSSTMWNCVVTLFSLLKRKQRTKNSSELSERWIIIRWRDMCNNFVVSSSNFIQNAKCEQCECHEHWTFNIEKQKNQTAFSAREIVHKLLSSEIYTIWILYNILNPLALAASNLHARAHGTQTSADAIKSENSVHESEFKCLFMKCEWIVLFDSFSFCLFLLVWNKCTFFISMG